MRVGVLGAGFWARYQILGWCEVPGVLVAAVADNDLGKAQALANELGIPAAYASTEELLEREKLDVVDVITPVASHLECVLQAAKAGLPVVCQKPMAANLDDAKEAVETCSELGVPFLIHENWRFQDPIQEFRRALDSNRIGKPFRARIQYSNAFPVFTNQPALKHLKQFMLMDMGCHILDVARFLFGECSDAVCRTASVHPEIAGEDGATVFMRSERCPTVIVEMSYASRFHPDTFPETQIVAEGSEGTLQLSQGGRLQLVDSNRVEEWTSMSRLYPWSDPAYALVHGGMVNCLNAIASTLRGEANEAILASDNLKTLELVFACYESAATDQAQVGRTL